MVLATSLLTFSGACRAVPFCLRDHLFGSEGKSEFWRRLAEPVVLEGDQGTLALARVSGTQRLSRTRLGRNGSVCLAAARVRRADSHGRAVTHNSNATYIFFLVRPTALLLLTS